jgi:hypothetical protein
MAFVFGTGSVWKGGPERVTAPYGKPTARTPIPSGGHSTATSLVTNARGRVHAGDAAGPPDEAAALGDEKAPAGRMPHPLDKPQRQERRLTAFSIPFGVRVGVGPFAGIARRRRVQAQLAIVASPGQALRALPGSLGL